jgi:homoserine O-succinyltransferase
MIDFRTARSLCDRSANSAAGLRETDATWLEIALVNNMPSAALEAAERQFRMRLEAAADGVQVRLTFYTFPEISRAEATLQRIERCYSNIDDLWNAQLDGLIVTGAEPHAPNLKEEAYWRSMTRLIEWAGHNTHSAIWSCLAAHAAVLHLDDIARRPLENKRSGVFECAKRSTHDLLSSVPARFYMPHSRWNEVPEEALGACGYTLLSGSEHAGVDAFAKNGNGKSMFVFFQGHPEYEAETLLLEYRRDITRFLRCEREHYPSMPCGYFDPNTVEMLMALRERALSDRSAERIADFPTAVLASRVRNTWSPAAVGIYRNWLLYLCAQKERRLRTTQRRSEKARGAGKAA